MAEAGLERIGDSGVGPAFELLRLLSVDGWYVGITAAFGGGILLVGEHPDFGTVEKQGETVADIAADFAQTCHAMSARGPLH